MRYKDMIGKKFGHLKVIGRSKRMDAKQRAFWVCRCDCEMLIEVRGDNLRRGITVACSLCHQGMVGGKPSVFVDSGVIDNGSV